MYIFLARDKFPIFLVTFDSENVGEQIVGFKLT